MSHQNVAAAGVIGVPDSERGQAIKAFIELSVDAMPSEALAEELRAHVKARLARHLYPRAIEFIAEMPRTVTGKVRRRDLRERRGGR
jgi:acetyl-CoA synthetase